MVTKTALLGACCVLAPLIVFRLAAGPGLASPFAPVLVAIAFIIPCAMLISTSLATMKQLREASTPAPLPRHTIQLLNAYLDPFKALMDSTKDSVYLLGRDGRLLFVNQAHLDRMGLGEHQVVGRYYQDVHSDEEWAKMENALNRVLRSNSPMDEEYQSPRDGGYYLRSITPVKDDKGRLSAALVTSKDISERHQFEDRMRNWALQDELTGLLNRRGFLLFAEQQKSVAKRLCRRLLVLFMDMDNLKVINDTLGHEQGNAAIQEMAQVMNDTFRKADILARVGGDEFAVLAFESTTGYAEALQSRLLRTVLAHNAKKGRHFDLSMSVGAVIWDPASEQTIEDVLVIADKQMYEEKMQKKASRPSR
ncbi:MAG TPA: GGDEF domain-containing protein [Dissulfurispiraceae bacterium]|nr:GGDEF domain-containing protein [Dissulfurispiraceae bacterium]